MSFSNKKLAVVQQVTSQLHSVWCSPNTYVHHTSIFPIASTIGCKSFVFPAQIIALFSFSLQNAMNLFLMAISHLCLYTLRPADENAQHTQSMHKFRSLASESSRLLAAATCPPSESVPSFTNSSAFSCPSITTRLLFFRHVFLLFPCTVRLYMPHVHVPSLLRTIREWLPIVVSINLRLSALVPCILLLSATHG